ncbi:MAG TPA: hypothetical protein VGQ00_02270 [Candidatus Norongarragalinales archaeon]|jgi:predicted nucleic acid-binding protein|nr:hypothetical protein [Candidatus Norongarragalinales archaeon]
MTFFIIDSSSIISLVNVCNAEALNFLRQRTGAKFVIPPTVYDETVTNPLRVKKFEYSAAKIQKLVDDGVLQLGASGSLQRNTQRVLELANRIFLVRGKAVAILQRGEAECLALLPEIGTPSALVIDEKTARLILENPTRLEERMSQEYAGRVTIDQNAVNDLQKLVGDTYVIRSTEVLAAAAKRGFFDAYGPVKEHAFHGALRALRDAGAAISQEELNEFERIQV